MTGSSPDPDGRPAAATTPWWRRRTPSVLVLVLVLALTGAATVWVGRSVADVLPEVGRDHLGEDAWEDPLGVYMPAGFYVVRIPDCAVGSFTRMALWDADSNPFWEVSGPPTLMTQFVVGAAPEGFTTTVEYRDPPPGAVLRLVAFRRNDRPVGIRFTIDQLSETRVVAGSPLRRYTVSGFQSAEVCASVDEAEDDDGIVRPDVSPGEGPDGDPFADEEPALDDGDIDDGDIDDGDLDDGELEELEELEYEDLIAEEGTG